jgi:hypothetical protein
MIKEIEAQEAPAKEDKSKPDGESKPVDANQDDKEGDAAKKEAEEAKAKSNTKGKGN